MSLFGRYLAHPTMGTAGELFGANEPLGAGRMTMLAANAQHMAEQNPIRVLRQHAGVRDFWASAVPPAFTSAPSARHIRWVGTPKTGECAIDLGVHWVWRLPDGRWPVARLGFTSRVEGGYTLGWVLSVSPGLGGPLTPSVDLAGVTTSASWTEESYTLALDGLRDTRPIAVAPTNGRLLPETWETGSLQVARFFLGAYCSSGVDASGSRASLVGISLTLELP